MPAFSETMLPAHRPSASVSETGWKIVSAGSPLPVMIVTCIPATGNPKVSFTVIMTVHAEAPSALILAWFIVMYEPGPLGTENWIVSA